MASQDVEFEAISDTGGKFAQLAKLLGLADADHARGKVEHLWMACTTRGETDLPQWLVEDKLGPLGPDALVEVELARWARGRGDSKTRRLYICGAKKHCMWLRRNQEQAPKGGETRARNASRVAGKFTADRAGDAGDMTSDQTSAGWPGISGVTTDQSRKSAKQEDQNTSPLPSPSPCPDLSLFPEEDLARSPPAPRGRKPPTGDHQRVIAAFETRYTERNGRGASWGSTQGNMVKQLLSKHPADEIIRRIGILFDSPPLFLTNSSPDLGTLVQHFDKLVAPTLATGTQRAGPHPNAPNRNPVLANLLDDIARREAAGET